MLRSNNKKFSQITGCKANACTPGSWIKSQVRKTRFQRDSCTSTVTSYYLGFRDWILWLWRALHLRKPDGQHLKYFWNSLQPEIIWRTKKKKSLPTLEDITDGVARGVWWKPLNELGSNAVVSSAWRLGSMPKGPYICRSFLHERGFTYLLLGTYAFAKVNHFICQLISLCLAVQFPLLLLFGLCLWLMFM